MAAEDSSVPSEFVEEEEEEEHYGTGKEWSELAGKDLEERSTKSRKKSLTVDDRASRACQPTMQGKPSSKKKKITLKCFFCSRF